MVKIKLLHYKKKRAKKFLKVELCLASTTVQSIIKIGFTKFNTYPIKMTIIIDKLKKAFHREVCNNQV